MSFVGFGCRAVGYRFLGRLRSRVSPFRCLGPAFTMTPPPPPTTTTTAATTTTTTTTAPATTTTVAVGPKFILQA